MRVSELALKSLGCKCAPQVNPRSSRSEKMCENTSGSTKLDTSSPHNLQRGKLTDNGSLDHVILGVSLGSEGHERYSVHAGNCNFREEKVASEQENLDEECFEDAEPPHMGLGYFAVPADHPKFPERDRPPSERKCKFSHEVIKLASKRLRGGRDRKLRLVSMWKHHRTPAPLHPYSEEPSEQKREKQERKPLLHLYLTHLIQEDCELKVKERLEEQADRTDEEITRIQLEASYRRKRTNVEFQRLMKMVPSVPRVPKYYRDKITGQIFQDPVITPEGRTYERASIKKHLVENGPSDPFTQTRLSLRQLTPNIAAREVVKAFIRENEWAIDMPTSHISQEHETELTPMGHEQ